ncbi:hypothetical protein MMC26_005438 [Xylographa opegraphella]|nr:hypothetical protein [Xylographa opegraphella]
MLKGRSGLSEPLESIAGNNVKKRRTNLWSLDRILALSIQDLSELPSDTLVSYLVDLQEAYKAVGTKLEAANRQLNNEVATTGIKAGGNMNKEQVRVKANKLSRMMASEIKKQMKWQIFLKLFNFGEEKKAWKQKKITSNAFEDITGELSASVLQRSHCSIRSSPVSRGLIIEQIRYGYLGITSKEVTIRWDEDDLSFSVSGL